MTDTTSRAGDDPSDANAVSGAGSPDAAPYDQSTAVEPVGAEPTPLTEDPAAAAAPGASKPGRAPRQTLAGRVWIAIVCAAILLVLIIIFVAENSRRVTISFLGAHGHISLALALLIGVVAGIAITLLVGSARIVQLTLEVRRHRRRIRELT